VAIGVPQCKFISTAVRFLGVLEPRFLLLCRDDLWGVPIDFILLPAWTPHGSSLQVIVVESHPIALSKT
ncbi:MAG: hypothetical protein Q4E32_07295, partial [Bacteroidales bacterium]|nr:hypothetical protein [Bacteroidales bacterium]